MINECDSSLYIHKFTDMKFEIIMDIKCSFILLITSIMIFHTTIKAVGEKSIVKKCYNVFHIVELYITLSHIKSRG